MTPHVINGEEDLERIKTVESERMSWALSDVIDIHGDVGLSGGGRGYGSNSTIIYPDTNPTGRIETVPTTTRENATSSSNDSPWKKLFSGFGNDTEAAGSADGQAGPRPEPSASRSSQSNANPIRRTSALQPDARVLYTPTPQQPTGGSNPSPSQPLPPAYPQNNPGNGNGLIQQPYPVGAATGQPQPIPYTAVNQPYYHPGYQTVPPANPNTQSNGYPASPYVPAGTTIR